MATDDIPSHFIERTNTLMGSWSRTRDPDSTTKAVPANDTERPSTPMRPSIRMEDPYATMAETSLTDDGDTQLGLEIDPPFSQM